jgi:hypothetical protein
MPIGILFWAIFIIWIVYSIGWWNWGGAWAWGGPGFAALVMVLLFLLGWAEFGFILQGGRAPFH